MHQIIQRRVNHHRAVGRRKNRERPFPPDPERAPPQDAEPYRQKIVYDQPVENNRSDAAMTPPEFLLASLATCAGCYAAQSMNTRRLPSANLKMKATAEKALNPARPGKFDTEIIARGRA